jgi:hypothetical protein
MVAKGKHRYTDVVLADASRLPFKDHQFEVVLAFDVIEHLDKARGLIMIAEAERVGTLEVVIFTPNGFLPQGALDDNPHQFHRSGWELPEFRAMGYDVVGMHGLKDLRREESRYRVRPYVVGVALSYLSQLVLWRRPEKAFHLLAIKKLSGVR